jgi:hypothetical protein
VEKQFFVKYLLFRSLTNPKGEDKLSAATKKSVDTALELDGDDHHRSDYARLLWSAAVETLTPVQIFGYLNPTKLQEWGFRCTGFYEVSDYRLSAAVIFGKLELLTAATHVKKLDLKSETLHQFENNAELFSGSVAGCANFGAKLFVSCSRRVC